jgi:ferritin
MNFSNLNDAFNQQILIELGNQVKYMQIHSFFEDLQLKNLSDFFLKAAEEEFGHAKKFMEYVNKRTGGKVTLGEVDAPNFEITSYKQVGDLYIKIEEDTTSSIESLYELAQEYKSSIDYPFILDMLNLQVPEEDEANEFAAKINLVSDIILFDATFGG